MLDVHNIVRHIGWSPYLLRRHLECRPYLIHSFQSYMEFTVLSVCEITELESVFIRITILFCVIGDRYKTSNH